MDMNISHTVCRLLISDNHSLKAINYTAVMSVCQSEQRPETDQGKCKILCKLQAAHITWDTVYRLEATAKKHRHLTRRQMKWRLFADETLWQKIAAENVLSDQPIPKWNKH